MLSNYNQEWGETQTKITYKVYWSPFPSPQQRDGQLTVLMLELERKDKACILG